MKKENLKGKKFNKLIAIEEAENKITPKGKKVTQWLCLCECGNKKIVSSNNLKRGHIKSCGCIVSKGSTKHNCSNKRIYHIYSNMIQRCTNINNKSYKDYGFRNIKVCDKWKKDFINFYNWAMKNGYEDNLTIDRIDVNGNYEPQNCRWVSKEIQARNKRNNNYITIHNETHCLSEWSRRLKIPVSTLRRKGKDDWIKLYNEYYSSMKLEERTKDE